MRRLLGVMLVCLEIWVPAVVLSWPVYRAMPARADEFLDRARQGQALGRSLVPQPDQLVTDTGDGTYQLNLPGGGVTLRPQDLFPDMANTTNPNPAELAGSDAGIINRAQEQVQVMSSSSSYTGQAYQTLSGSINRARVNMSSDPLWGQTDLAMQQVMSGTLADCRTEMVASVAASAGHIPDYRTCERVMRPAGGVCKLRHDYEVRIIAEFGAGYEVYVRDKVYVTLDLLTPQIVAHWGSQYRDLQLLAGEPVAYDLVCGELAEGMRLFKLTDNLGAYNHIQTPPDCSQPGTLQVTAYTCQHSNCNAPGEGDDYRYTVNNLSWKVVQLVDRGWSADPGCEVLLTNPAGDAFVRPVSYECTQGPCEEAASVNGVWLEQSDFPGPNPLASQGISSLTREVTVPLASGGFNVGQMECWTDPQGVEHCPHNDGDRQDTCEALATNPACSFVRQECLEGARDPDSGRCYAWTLVYDCGFDVSLGNGSPSHLALVCDGVIRCLGTECIEGQFDPNNQDFARAAAMLQAVQYASTDLDCSEANAGGCEIFKGQPYECKKALGGWVDCCVEPEGISFVDYIKLLVNLYTLTATNWTLYPFGINVSNPYHGIYDALSHAWDYTTDLISSAWDSLIGVTEEATTEAVKITLTQRLINAAYDFTSTNFPSLAEHLFVYNSNTGMASFTPWLSNLINVVQFVMWIYTIYNILDILVHIIWACEEEEFELGAKRQMKVCHYVGSYCRRRVLGVCIEKRDTYCCFNSPLSRILQEQIRLQTPRDWGNGEAPDCGGLRPPELAQVDWDRVDLSEWLALLSLAGEMPTQRDLSLAGLTGSGSQFAFDGHITRPDAAQRTQERLAVYQNQTGQGLEQLRINRGLQLWGTAGQ